MPYPPPMYLTCWQYITARLTRAVATPGWFGPRHFSFIPMPYPPLVPYLLTVYHSQINQSRCHTRVIWTKTFLLHSNALPPPHVPYLLTVYHSQINQSRCHTRVIWTKTFLLHSNALPPLVPYLLTVYHSQINQSRCHTRVIWTKTFLLHSNALPPPPMYLTCWQYITARLTRAVATPGWFGPTHFSLIPMPYPPPPVPYLLTVYHS